MLAHAMARPCGAMKGNGDALKGNGDAQLGKEWSCIGKAPFSIVLQWQRDVWSRKGTATQSTATEMNGAAKALHRIVAQWQSKDLKSNRNLSIRKDDHK